MKPGGVEVSEGVVAATIFLVLQQLLHPAFKTFGGARPIDENMKADRSNATSYITDFVQKSQEISAYETSVYDSSSDGISSKSNNSGSDSTNSITLWVVLSVLANIADMNEPGVRAVRATTRSELGEEAERVCTEVWKWGCSYSCTSALVTLFLGRLGTEKEKRSQKRIAVNENSTTALCPSALSAIINPRLVLTSRLQQERGQYDLTISSWRDIQESLLSRLSPEIYIGVKSGIVQCLRATLYGPSINASRDDISVESTELATPFEQSIGNFTPRQWAKHCVAFLQLVRSESKVSNVANVENVLTTEGTEKTLHRGRGVEEEVFRRLGLSDPQLWSALETALRRSQSSVGLSPSNLAHFVFVSKAVVDTVELAHQCLGEDPSTDRYIVYDIEDDEAEDEENDCDGGDRDGGDFPSCQQFDTADPIGQNEGSDDENENENNATVAAATSDILTKVSLVPSPPPSPHQSPNICMRRVPRPSSISSTKTCTSSISSAKKCGALALMNALTASFSKASWLSSYPSSPPGDRSEAEAYLTELAKFTNESRGRKVCTSDFSSFGILFKSLFVGESSVENEVECRDRDMSESLDVIVSILCACSIATRVGCRVSSLTYPEQISVPAKSDATAVAVTLALHCVECMASLSSVRPLVAAQLCKHALNRLDESCVYEGNEHVLSATITILNTVLTSESSCNGDSFSSSSSNNKIIHLDLLSAYDELDTNSSAPQSVKKGEKVGVICALIVPRLTLEFFVHPPRKHPYPLPLTPYPLPLTPYPLPLTPYPLPLRP